MVLYDDDHENDHDDDDEDNDEDEDDELLSCSLVLFWLAD